MPKITADIPEDLYRYVKSKILDQRLEGEPTTVSSLVTDMLYNWKNGGMARRRRGGALASPPIEESSPGSDAVEARSVGQDIDDALEGLSQEERDRLRAILVPLARQLVRLVKVLTGG